MSDDLFPLADAERQRAFEGGFFDDFDGVLGQQADFFEVLKEFRVGVGDVVDDEGLARLGMDERRGGRPGDLEVARRDRVAVGVVRRVAEQGVDLTRLTHILGFSFLLEATNSSTGLLRGSN